MSQILTVIIYLTLFIGIFSQSYYLDKSYNFLIEKGTSWTFIVPDNYRYTNILLYCSIEDAMEISNGGSTIIKTRMYILNTAKYNYDNTYEIRLKSKNKSYYFQSLYISKELQVEYADSSFQFEINTYHQYLAGALIFVDARDISKEDIMLFYRHMGGNDVEFLYFPLTDDIDFTRLCHNYNYREHSQTGNPFHPSDDYFILKFIGSVFDIKIQYLRPDNDYQYIPLFNGKEFSKSATISSSYNYKVDYILGSNQNCKVEVGQYYNNTYRLLSTLSDNNNRYILSVQNLVFRAKNCDAVITVVPNNQMNNFQLIDINVSSKISKAYLANVGYTLFRIPKRETDFKIFNFDIHVGYKLGSDYYPCNIYKEGLILIHDDFIEDPIYKITMYKEGEYKYISFFNPYYYPNPHNKFKDDTYYIIFECNCYFAKASYLQIEYSLDSTVFNLNDAPYLSDKRINILSENIEVLKNFYQIDPPTKGNTLLTARMSSCQPTFRFFLLSNFTNVIGDLLGLSEIFIWNDCKEFIGNEALYIDFEYLKDKLLFYYEYIPYNESYKPKFTGLSQQFNITNSKNRKIKVSFYPIAYDEEVEYKLYIVNSDEDFQTLCHYYYIDANNKTIKDIGTFQINTGSNETDQPITKEIELDYSKKQTLKIGIFYKTINNYKIQSLYEPISFNYEPSDDDSGFPKDIFLYGAIIIGSIFIIALIMYWCKNRNGKNNNEIENIKEILVE